MKAFLPLAAAGLLMALSGCAVLSKPELASIRERRVAAPTMRKLENDAPLLPQDVIELTRRGVPQAQIVRYVDDTEIPYLLTKDDSLRMRRAGVSQVVIDLMARESAKFAADYRALQQQEIYYDSIYQDPFGPMFPYYY
jgi:hypothetical protein